MEKDQIVRYAKYFIGCLVIIIGLYQLISALDYIILRGEYIAPLGLIFGIGLGGLMPILFGLFVVLNKKIKLSNIFGLMGVLTIVALAPSGLLWPGVSLVGIGIILIIFKL